MTTTTLERLRGRLYAPQRKLTRTIYLDPAGDDGNSGWLDEPVASFPRAIEMWERLASVRPGPVAIQSVASATYTLSEALDFDDALVLDSPLTIVGAVDGGGVPTVILRGSSDGTRTLSPLLATNGVRVSLQDVKLQSFSSAVRGSRGGRVTFTNVHSRNCVRVLSLGNMGWANITGGDWDGRDLDGVAIADNVGMVAVIGSFYNLEQPAGYSSPTALKIHHVDRGVVVDECGSGHMDNLMIEDCTSIGVEVTRGAGSPNMSGTRIYRCPVGVLGRNAPNLQISDSMNFGQGTADACTDPIVLTFAPTNAQIDNTSYDSRPLFQARAKADGNNLTGDTSERNFTQSCFLVASRMRTRDTLDMYLSGVCSGGLAAVGTLRLYVGASSIKSVTLPIGTRTWRVRVTLIATSKTTLRGLIEVVDDTDSSGGNINLTVITTTDGTDKVSLSANTEVKMTWQAGDAADNFQMSDQRVVTSIAGIATS